MRLAKGQDPRQVIEEMLGQSLSGPAGNAWAVTGLTRGYLVDSGFEEDAIKELMKDAMKGDYENVLRVCAEALLET